MRFFLFLYFLFLSIFWPHFVFGDFNIPFCPCDKIKKEKSCENPDCIKVCGLNDMFSKLGGKVREKCLKGGVLEKIFSNEKVKLTKLQRFIKGAKDEIKEMDRINKRVLKENCPSCDFLSEMKGVFSPIYKERNCSKQYLKTHEYTHKVQLKEAVHCGDKQKSKIVKELQKYVQNIVSDSNNNELSKKLWSQCPESCSFATQYIIRVDESDCLGNLDLKVTCTHRVDRSAFVPIYNTSIIYKGEISCKE